MRLSIITINYNNCEGLRKTIESVVNQTWEEFEWIIVDGGSTDGSKELIEDISDKCSKIVFWCSEPDHGVYNAMNKGVSHASGEYINFMNSGDIFASHTILEEIFSSNRSADILYGYMMRRTIDGDINNARNMKPKLSYMDFYYDTLGHQSTFTKKHVFEVVGGFDESFRILADWVFFIHALFFINATYEFLPLKISIYECDGLSETPQMRKDLARIHATLYPNNFGEIDASARVVMQMREIPFFKVCYACLYRLFDLYCKMIHRYE